MPDLIQVADDLKNAPDQWLAQQMQSPTGSVPPWLVASEVARRDRLRSGASKGQMPTSSVSQDLIRSLYARIPPTAGLMPGGAPPGGAPPGGPTPPGMPPVNLTPNNGATLGAAPGGTPPANFRMPPRAMAAGGEYDESDDEEEPIDMYGLPMRAPTRRDQLNQLMVPPVRPVQQAMAAPPAMAAAPMAPAAPTPPAAPMPLPPVMSAGTPRFTPQAPQDPISRLVADAAQRYQLPPELIRAVIKSESSGDTRAVSKKGALGLMQIMPGTAAEMGIKDPQMLLDPAINIDTGARYLKKMMGMFGNDPRLALQAYNAGPGAVKKYHGNVPYAETIGYTNKTLKTINALREQTGMQPLDPAQPNAELTRLIGQQFGPPEPAEETPAPEFNDWRKNAAREKTALMGQLNMSLPPTAAVATAAPAPAAPNSPTAPPVLIKKPEPLHQVWEQSDTAPEADKIQKQIDARQQGHTSVEDRQSALLGEDNLSLLKRAGETIFGKPQDYRQYSSAIQQLMGIAQQSLHPNIGQSLIQFGMALMASPSHNFGQAVGQAGAYAMQNYMQMKRQGAQDYLTAVKAGVELQEKTDLYNARIGQYKMQRLGQQQGAVTQDERAFQQEIAGLERQKNTAQINYAKTLTTPAAVNNMAAAIMNRENIEFDPKKEPIGQLAATGNTKLLEEAYLAGKPGGAGKGLNSVQQTQDIRATSLLAMIGAPWDPEKNPDDAQFPSSMDKLKKVRPDLAGMATTAQGANFPEQMKEAESLAQGIISGRIDPSMTGMYGKQVLIKAILENKYHYDLAKATLEWDATKKFIQTANSADAVKYRQSVAFVSQQIPLVKSAYDEWKKSLSDNVPDFLTRFKGFNRAALNASIAMGGDLGASARRLESHIAELQASLPTVYSGGYAPHTEDIDRAGKMIAADWDDPAFNTALGVITDTMLARKNAVELAQPRPTSTYGTNALGGGAGGGGGPQQQQPQQQQAPPLPPMLSPGDVGKTFRHPDGRMVIIKAVDPNDWHRVKFQVVQ